MCFIYLISNKYVVFLLHLSVCFMFYLHCCLIVCIMFIVMYYYCFVVDICDIHVEPRRAQRRFKISMEPVVPLSLEIYLWRSMATSYFHSHDISKAILEDWKISQCPQKLSSISMWESWDTSGGLWGATSVVLHCKNNEICKLHRKHINFTMCI